MTEHTPAEVEKILAAQLRDLADEEDEISLPQEKSFDTEVTHAAKVKTEARKIVGNVLADARLGKQVTLGPIRDSVHKIAESMFRNTDAIMSLSLIKQRDEYTFMHSVNVGVILMAFCSTLDLSETTIIDAGIGGMLHDIGKMRTPEAILNKAGKLSDEEFKIMRQHATFSQEITSQIPNISATSVYIAAQHHERFDGSGYPKNLKGDQIDKLGQMAAIVDVYDAITSDRVYHKGNPPQEALKRMLAWSKQHFDPGLFQRFVQCIGIYPIGSLVRLENGLLGMVIRSNQTNLLHPVIKILIDANAGKRLQPRDINLMDYKNAPSTEFRIVRSESLEKWQVDPKAFIPKFDL